MSGRRRSVIAAIVGVVATLLLLAIAGLVVVRTGAYNVAATQGHTSLGRWALDTTMINSVKGRASGLEPPARFTPEMIAAGAGEYKAMCAQCHAAPGEEREAWSEGMLPQPPHLTEAATQWETGEIFWIVKHGIRMSGMLAFGPTHDDATLWNIAGFVAQLPGMTPQRYAAFPAGHGSEPHGHGSEPPGHGSEPHEH